MKKAMTSKGKAGRRVEQVMTDSSFFSRWDDIDIHERSSTGKLWIDPSSIRPKYIDRVAMIIDRLHNIGLISDEQYQQIVKAMPKPEGRPIRWAEQPY